jgi:hypothetical protein
MIKVFACISSLSILIPLFIGLYFYKSLRSKTSKAFLFFIILTAITEVFSLILGFNLLNNLWLGNIYTFIPVIVFQLILYYEVNFKSNFIRYLVNIILICSYVYGIINLKNIYVFNSINSVVFSFLTIVICVCLLIKVINEINIFQNSFLFWISAGMLVYSSITLLLYGLFYSLSTSNDKLLFLYTIPQTIINLSINIIFAKSLYGVSRK